MRHRKRHHGQDDDSLESIVYAYGGAFPLAGWEAAQAEMARQRELWNRLVELDREADRQLLELAGQAIPAITEIRNRLETLTAEYDALVAERRAKRRAARKRIATPELDAAIDAKRRTLRAARRELWALVRDWRRTHPDEYLQWKIQRRTAIVAARRASTCYWCNYDRVLDDFDCARQAKFRGKGSPRIKIPTEDEGVLTVKINRTRSGLGASAMEILSGQCPQVNLDLAERGWSRLSIRIDADGHELVMPVMIHRPLPLEGRIKRVQVTWWMDGAQRRFQAAFTVVKPAIPPITHPGQTAIGIDLGFRLQADGSLLVATGVDSNGAIHRWALPASWMAQMDYADAEPEHPDQERVWVEKRNLRAKLIRRRGEYYMTAIARPLCQTYAVITLEKWNMAKTARKKQNETAEPELPPPARRNRHRAALSTLRDAIELQAKKFGTRLIWIKGPTTQQCAHCGERTRTPHDRSELIWTCSRCGAKWDQDINAARNLLAAATGAPTGTELVPVAG
jgi:hypothetical protein